MSTISFVVRDGAGNYERGLVGSQGMAAVAVTPGQAISLNLRPNQVASYARNGQALEITLNDGQVIVLQDFFAAGGSAQADLYMSTDGVLSEVALIDGGNGALMADYQIIESSGKWSPTEGLYFGDSASLATADPAVMSPDVGMLNNGIINGLDQMSETDLALLGGALLGGAALLAGSGGSGGSDDDDSQPASGGTTDGGTDGGSDGGSGGGDNGSGGGDNGSGGGDNGSGGGDGGSGGGNGGDNAPVVAITSGTRASGTVVNKQDHDDGTTIGGTGTPGATVTVTVGDASETTTVASDGSWTVTFDQTQVEAGDYSSSVSVTATNSGGSASATDILDVDTITSVTFDEDAVGGTDHVINKAESTAVVLNGTVEEGSTSVIVTVRGTDYSATITGGTWSLDLPASVLTQGEYELPVSVRSVDAHGNTASTSGVIEIDNVVDPLTSDTIEGEPGGAQNLVNSQEAVDGVQLVGSVEAGSTVVVTYLGQTYNATVTGTEWAVTLPEGELRQGQANVTITATDAHGNSASISDSFMVDTTDPQAPDIGDVVDSGPAVLGVFTNAPIDGSTELHQIAADGTITEMATPAPAPVPSRTEGGSDGQLFLFGQNDTLPDGSHLIVTAREDSSGNSSSTFVAMQDPNSSVVTVDPAQLSDYSITSIDLDIADSAELTLSAADVAALSQTSNTLQIHGDAQDRVTLEGATETSETRTEGSTTFNVYTLPDGHEVLVDEDITNVTVI